MAYMLNKFDEWTKACVVIDELYTKGMTNIRGAKRQAKLKKAKRKLLDLNEEVRGVCAESEHSFMEAMDRLRAVRQELAERDQTIVERDQTIAERDQTLEAKNELIEELTLERDDVIRESDELRNKLEHIETIVDFNLKAKEEYENNDESNEVGSS